MSQTPPPPQSRSSLETHSSNSSRTLRGPSPIGGTRTTLQVDLNGPSKPSTPSGRSSTTAISSFDVEESASKKVFRLQPADEGFGAWSYAACAFTMFIVVWGFPEAFPIFQSHLAKREEYKDSVVLPLLSPGINDIIEGLMFPILPRAPKYRRPLVIAGICLIVTSLALASGATEDWHIVLTQGLTFGIGGILMNFVHVSIFAEWFDKKRGQAMSFIWQGWRLGSIAFPPICQWLLETQGYEATLQWLLAPMLPLLLPTILMFRGRFAPAAVDTQPTQPEISRVAALAAPKVLFHLFAVLLFSMVVNVPTMFIMLYGEDLGLDATHQVVSYTLRSVSAMIGIYAFGKFSDGQKHLPFMIASPLLSAVTYILLWGFAKSKVALYLYAIVIGLTSGGYDNVLYGMYNEISGDNGALFTAVHGLFSLVRGIAVLSIGPVGTAIIRRTPIVEIDSWALGKYQYLVIYVAIMSMASGLLMLSRLVYMQKYILQV